MNRSDSYAVALCGVGCALTIVLMLMGALIPLFMFIAPALGGVLVMIICTECGKRYAWTEYAAATLLSLILVPDKELSLTYLYLGCYPLLKPSFDHIRTRLLRVCAKLFYLNVSVLAVYAVLYLLLFPGMLESELADYGLLLVAVTLLLGNAAFLLYDKALVGLLQKYCSSWRVRLFGRQKRR